MAKVIRKFLLWSSREELHLPPDAQVLTVALDRDAPHVWVLYDPQQPRQRRVLCVYPSEGMVPDDHGRYVGSFQPDRELMFHVFEVISA